MRRLDAWWLTGAIGGFCAVLALVGAWRITGGRTALGVDVRVLAAPTGELGVSPIGEVLTGLALKPGAEAAGTVLVRNQTARSLAICLQLAPDTHDLDRMLTVAVASPDGRGWTQPLAELERRSRVFVRLTPGELCPVTVRVRLIPSATGYRGRRADIALRLLSAVAS